MLGASFDNWLDAVDGSFCTFEGGDSPDFVCIHVVDSGPIANMPTLRMAFTLIRLISLGHSKVQHSHLHIQDFTILMSLL